MVMQRQSRLQGTPQSFYGTCDLSKELFYHENYAPSRQVAKGGGGGGEGERGGA